MIFLYGNFTTNSDLCQSRSLIFVIKKEASDLAVRSLHCENLS